jgi:hypothetical protein
MSDTYLADSLVAASPFAALDWDEEMRESAKCLGARTRRIGLLQTPPACSALVYEL